MNQPTSRRPPTAFCLFSSTMSNTSNNSSSRTSDATVTATASTASHRLARVSAQMATATSFPESAVPQAPEDPLFGLAAAYRADTDPNKVDLGIGAYRDNNAKPWILPVVKKVSMQRRRGFAAGAPERRADGD